MTTWTGTLNVPSSARSLRPSSQLLARLPGHDRIAAAADEAVLLIEAGCRLPLPLVLAGARGVAARQYLTRCLGQHRVAHEAGAAKQITRRAAGSPMALALTVAHLAADPDRPFAELVSGAPSRVPADPSHPPSPVRRRP